MLRLATLFFAPLAPAAMLLAGCSPEPEDIGPTGVTENEARALDDAAAMIEPSRRPEGAPSPTGSETPPAPQETGA